MTPAMQDTCHAGHPSRRTPVTQDTSHAGTPVTQGHPPRQTPATQGHPSRMDTRHAGTPVTQGHPSRRDTRHAGKPVTQGHPSRRDTTQMKTLKTVTSQEYVTYVMQSSVETCCKMRIKCIIYYSAYSIEHQHQPSLCRLHQRNQ